MENIKKVYCLYRVSTTGQVEKNDIPMQKDYCREFVAGHSDWEIVKELYEKGVSGFKKSAKDRDAIQQIQADALQGKFNILLVFMFDRLGRRDDETPFIVEWFVKNGVEVWSAMEGQQRFDSHVDKLMNYIRFWQASGESIKTAIRVKTRFEQLTEAGLFTGGSLPYGYRLIKNGRVNKKNQEVRDIEKVESEAEIVRLIFNKYVNEGYGLMRLSRYLKENNIRRSNGKDFPNTTLNHIIKNQLYIGIIHNGEAHSEPIEDLRIIDEETFYRAQEISQARVTHRNDVPLNTKGQALLVGKVYCGHCGGKLTLTTSGKKRVCENGVLKWVAKPRYQCHYNVRHPGECDGQSGYGMKKLDTIVDLIVLEQLKLISEAPSYELISRQHEKAVHLEQAKLQLLNQQLAEKKREVDDYQTETIRVIRGESKFSAELLNDLIEKAKTEIETLTLAIKASEEELFDMKGNISREKDEYTMLKNWADIYEESSLEAKKMFLSQFIKSIRVYRDYRLEIEFNVSFEEFKSFSEIA